MIQLIIGVIVAIVLLALLFVYYTASAPVSSASTQSLPSTDATTSPVVDTQPVVPTPTTTQQPILTPVPTQTPVSEPTPAPIVAATPAPVHTYKYADGVPLAGGSGMLGSVGGTTSWQQCQSLCDSQDGCTAFWYSQIGTGGNCYWQSVANPTFHTSGIMGAYAGIRLT
jgi:hypothetical protein